MIRIRGDPDAPRQVTLAHLKPEGEVRDLVGRVTGLQQLLHRLRRWRRKRTANQQELWRERMHLPLEALGLLQPRRSPTEHHDPIERLTEAQASLGRKPEPVSDAPQEPHTQQHDNQADESEQPWQAELTSLLARRLPSCHELWDATPKATATR